MTFEDYKKLPGINASFLKACLGGAYDGFKCLTDPKLPNDAMEFGTAVHTALLEPEKFKNDYCLVPMDAPKKPTKAQLEAKKPAEKTVAQIAWWAAFNEKNQGRKILDPDDQSKIQRIVKNCNEIAIVKEALETFEKEKVVTLGDFKGQLDLYGNEAVIDVKTTRNANERDFIRDTVNLGYDLQLLHYAKLVNASCVYAIAIETDTCEVACYDMADIVFSGFTKDRYNRALEVARYVLTLKECPNKFKAEIVSLKLPNWAKEPSA